MLDEPKWLKLIERQEFLTKKKEKIEDELKTVNKKIKEIEQEQKIKNIEDTIIVISERGIDIKDVLKEIQTGNLDYLKKQMMSGDQENTPIKEN